MEQNFDDQKKGSIDELIICFLMENNGEATWGQLRKCRPKQLADPVLKKAIDRLKKEHVLLTKAGFINDKAETLYCLVNPLPIRNDQGFSFWVKIFVDAIEANRKTFEHDPSKLNAEIRDKQCEGLSLLINMLTDTILVELTKYSEKTNDTEAMEYLDIVIHKQIAVMIKMIAQVVSPRYGSAIDPIEVLRMHLFNHMLLNEEELLKIQQVRRASVNKL